MFQNKENKIGVNAFSILMENKYLHLASKPTKNPKMEKGVFIKSTKMKVKVLMEIMKFFPKEKKKTFSYLITAHRCYVSLKLRISLIAFKYQSKPTNTSCMAQHGKFAYTPQ